MTPKEYDAVAAQIAEDIPGMLYAHANEIVAAIHNAKRVHDPLKPFSFSLKLTAKLSDAEVGGTLVKTTLGWNVAERVETESVVSVQPELAGFREAMGDGGEECPEASREIV